MSNAPLVSSVTDDDAYAAAEFTDTSGQDAERWNAEWLAYLSRE